MGMVSNIKAKWKRDKWAEPDGLEPRDEYRQARWVAEGEGAGATKAALGLTVAIVSLSIALVAVGTIAAMLYADSGKVRMVALPQGAGETTIFRATVIEGELQSNTTIKQWIIARWLDQWRGVGLDPVGYNRSYFESQSYMCKSVADRIDGFAKEDANDPAKLTPEKMLKQGVTRRVTVNHILPRGGEESNAFRVDWTETMYRNSQIIGQATATADLDLKHFPAQTDAVALQNPYGLYVCAFDWNVGPAG